MTKRARTLISAFLGAIALCGTAVAAEPAVQVYAGGVAGMKDMLEPGNSDGFRAAGGGLYLHNNGWGDLDAAERKQLLDLFRGRPVAVELGFTEGATAWATAFKDNYLAAGVNPVFIAANAFAGDHKPTVDSWDEYVQAFRRAGLAETSRILPTFEYQNFGPNIATLPDNRISRSEGFQSLARKAGGIVLDTPSGYFFSREEAYRDWVVDAIRWARAEKLLSVVIVSPHIFGERYSEDTERFVRYLREHDAVPDVVVSENYEAGAAADYPNRVGSEDKPDTALGVARWLQKDFSAHRAASRTPGTPDASVTSAPR